MNCWKTNLSEQDNWIRIVQILLQKISNHTLPERFASVWSVICRQERRQKITLKPRPSENTWVTAETQLAKQVAFEIEMGQMPTTMSLTGYMLPYVTFLERMLIYKVSSRWHIDYKILRCKIYDWCQNFIPTQEIWRSPEFVSCLRRTINTACFNHDGDLP